MNEVIVADIMTRNLITIKPEMDLLNCAKIMIKKRAGSILIVDQKKLRGFISEHDILWAFTKAKTKAELSKIRVIDISPKKIATIRPTAGLQEVIKKMKHLKFEKLPVIDKGELVGMVTVNDILNFKPELYPELNEFSEIREASNKLTRIKKAKERKSMNEGICEECGNVELLYRFNGMLVCESCQDRT